MATACSPLRRRNRSQWTDLRGKRCNAGCCMIRKRILSNIAWMFLERVIVTLVVLASNIYVVRSLGVSKFGELSYLHAVLGLVVVVADFGLRRVLLVRSEERRVGKECRSR